MSRSLYVPRSPASAAAKLAAASASVEAYNRYSFVADGTRLWGAAPLYGTWCFCLDAWYAISQAPWLFTDAQIKNLFLKWMSLKDEASGLFPAAVRPDMTTLWYSGADHGHNAPLGDGAFIMPQWARLYYMRTGDASDFVTWAPSLKAALLSLERNPDTGLIRIREGASTEWVAWGFNDSMRPTGDNLMGSCLFWAAANALRAMYVVVGDTVNAATMAGHMATVQANIRATFWDASSGMFLAATAHNNQIDICGSSYAVFLGIPTVEQSLSVSRYIVANYGRISRDGFVRQCPDNWNYSYSIGDGASLGVVGDNGFWSVHHLWLLETMLLTSPTAAVKLVTDFAYGSDPKMEFWGQPTSFQGSPYNLESPTGAASFTVAHPELFAR